MEMALIDNQKEDGLKKAAHESIKRQKNIENVRTTYSQNNPLRTELAAGSLSEQLSTIVFMEFEKIKV